VAAAPSRNSDLSRVRILYLSDFFWPYIGGPEVLSAVLLPEMARRGHDMLVVTSHGDRPLPDHEHWRGVAIHRLHCRRALESQHAATIGDLIRKVIDLKRTFSPHVIHLGMIGPAMVFHLQSSRQVPVPTLATVQTDLRSFGHDTVASQLLRASRWVRFVSARLLESTCAHIPELRSKASVIYSFFPIEEGPTSPLPFDPPRLLCLGRLSPEKNLPLALEAFARVRSVFPAVRLVVAGEGPECGTLVQRVQALGLLGSVEFLGRVEPDAVPAILKACTALLVSSLREGLPTAAIAAALLGRPIVATRVGSIDEVVVHASTGLLVEPSSDALGEAVIRLLRDPQQASQMGIRARERARERFDQRRCIDAFEAVYEAIRSA